MSNYPAQNWQTIDLIRDRGCMPISAYRAGFEDTIYEREYRNPFAVGSADWRKYEKGNEDARQQIIHRIAL